MYYLTKEDLLDLHIFATLRYGGLLGIASQDRLQTALNAPRQQMFGVELYPDVYSKAAVLTYFLVKNRPFVGGNEVTALMTLFRFLAINDVELRDDIDEDELFWLFNSLNRSNLDRVGLEEWLRDHVLAYNP